MAVEFTKENFAQTDEGLAIIDFWATWCGPCRMQGPVIEQLASEYEGEILIGKVDVDQQKELAAQFGVMSIPTIVFKKDGQVVDQVVGYHSKDQLEASIARLK